MGPFTMKTASGCEVEMHPDGSWQIDIVLRDGPWDGYSTTFTLEEAGALHDALGRLLAEANLSGNVDSNGGIAP